MALIGAVSSRSVDVRPTSSRPRRASSPPIRDPNPTVVTSLSMAALAVAAAIFLIVELNTPFNGLLQMPTAPARAVVAALGK